MRKTIIILLCLVSFHTISLAQSKSVKKPFVNYFNASINGSFNMLMGNNFIAKTYSPSFASGIDLNGTLFKNFGIGFKVEGATYSIKNSSYIGNSNRGKFSEYGGNFSYCYQFKNKWAFVPRISYTTLSIKNQLADNYGTTKYDYYTTGEKISFAPELHYFLRSEISIFTNVHYDHLWFSGVNANPIVGVSYKKADAVGVGLGLRFWINNDFLSFLHF